MAIVKGGAFGDGFLSALASEGWGRLACYANNGWFSVSGPSGGDPTKIEVKK